MKKVILEEKKIEVYLNDLTSSSIVGLESSSGNRFALCKTNAGYEYVGEANFLSAGKCSYLNLENALKSKGDLFVFETTKELFKWMSE